ncbi:MAG: response regulator [Bacteroidales bacterium]|nr:response regulator [Bacteroidales bacterium]
MIESSLKNANILIVDDQKANIDVLKGLLEMQGYTSIKTVTDPREVSQLYKTFNPDLILLDLFMPYLSGFQVMELLKPIIPDTTFLPILVLTADVSRESKQKALSGGASDFLNKPFDLIEVGMRIKNLLHTRYLHQLMEKQNQLLEEKVKERTIKLELSNEELIIARDKAQESNRLKTAFLNNISHEIRTPLNGILGFAPFIVDPDVSQDDKDQYLEFLYLSSDRLVKTVADIMDMSLIVSGNMKVKNQTICVSSVFERLNEKFSEPCSKKGLELKMNYSALPDNLTFETDGDLLFMALSHLFDNAIKFTTSGTINISCQLSGTHLKFSVKDTGVGIMLDAQKRILEAFEQENYLNTRGHEGSGLGLSIAAGLAKLMEGKLHIESEKHVGTEVCLTIPANHNLNNQDQQVVMAQIDSPKKLSSILIAEDDEVSYLYLETKLQDINANVTRANNGYQVLEICRNNPDIDLILMDIKMPEMDGPEAVRQIRLFNTEVKIIAQTAYGHNEDKNKALEAGCDDYISKPIDFDKFKVILKKYFII